VTYPLATAVDNCAVASVTCAPASGSKFPIGVTTVTCTAADTATPANTASCTFTVTVRSPRMLQQYVLDQLVILRADQSDRSIASLNWGIAYLNIALGNTYWLNETHLTHNIGNQVFYQDKQAITALSKVINATKTKNPALSTALQDLLNLKRLSTQILAQFAAAECMGPKRQALAQKYITAGDSATAVMIAVEDYRLAWYTATH
jgi:hypothetical protein